MKKYILLISFSFMLSSTYEIKIQLDSYEGIRPGTTIKYKTQNAGKVKSIAENKVGGYTVTMAIYNEIQDINSNYMFKIKNSKLIVDLEGMENRQRMAEEELKKVIKAKEDLEVAKKAREIEKKRIQDYEIKKEKIKQQEMIAEKERLLKVQLEEELRLTKLKSEKEARDKRLQLAADNSPFKGDIDKIKAFQKENDLTVDGFWGPGSQKVFDSIKTQKEKERISKEAKAKVIKDAKIAAEKAKAVEQAKIAAEKAKAVEQAKIAAEKAKIAAEKAKQQKIVIKSEKINEMPSRSEQELLLEQYDKPPKLKKKLKIKASKYKGQGSVLVKFFVNKKGRTEEVTIKQSSGNEKFDSDVISSVKKSKWKPAQKNNRKVGVWHILEVKF